MCEEFTQARNQLGKPGGAKSFPKRAQIFWTMSNIFEFVQNIFPGEAENFLGDFAPWLRAWVHDVTLRDKV